MSNKLIFLCALALLIGCSENSIENPVEKIGATAKGMGLEPGLRVEPSTEPEAEAKPVAFNVAGAPTVMFEVSDMVCESCSAAVHDTLAAQPGVKDVTVDLESKVATVAVDEAAFNSDEAVAALLDKQFSNAKLKEAPAKPAEPVAPAAPEPSDS